MILFGRGRGVWGGSGIGRGLFIDVVNVRGIRIHNFPMIVRSEININQFFNLFIIFDLCITSTPSRYNPTISPSIGDPIASITLSLQEPKTNIPVFQSG